MEPKTASPCARALSAALRGVRLDLEVAPERLAVILGIAPSVLAAWERGTEVPSPEQVVRLLGALEVTGRRYEQTLRLARHAGETDWLATLAGRLPLAQQTALGYEQAAERVTVWSLMVLPELLQTAEYARELWTKTVIGPEEIDTRLVLSLGRQEILTRPDPVKLLALISEHALEIRVGDDEAMTRQFDHLLALSELDNVALRIVPTGTGFHGGMHGNYVRYEFDGFSPAIFLENHFVRTFMHDSEGVRIYQDLSRQLLAKSLSEKESRARLEELKKNFSG
ncbi:helix-turn-helix domain-containing protein [Amycolatopsis sp. NPDC059021]|uniref:helix-turn-helix domain-containing protein n=1 Tax=Amycolatopsis sp. NPDC059021 TaxID=3346704 RepID=UPI003670DA0E